MHTQSGQSATQSATWTVLQNLLGQCSPQEKSALIRLMPKEDFALCMAAPSIKNPLQVHLSPKDCLRRIHFSWISPVLRNYSENEIFLFLSSLEEQLIADLRENLLLRGPLLELKDHAIDFLRQQLLQQLLGKQTWELLPISCLPEDPLSYLLEMKFQDLMLLTDLLGIHDLSFEIRQIIDTSKLKQIYQALSPEQARYLKEIASKKESIAFKRMALSQWDGNLETLRRLLQQRGVNRLAKATYGKDPRFLWYLIHQFDVATASYFQKLCTPLEHPRAAALLQQQVQNLIFYIQNLKSKSSL